VSILVFQFYFSFFFLENFVYETGGVGIIKINNRIFIEDAIMKDNWAGKDGATIYLLGNKLFVSMTFF
jgi:hypothetical protein